MNTVTVFLVSSVFFFCVYLPNNELC